MLELLRDEQAVANAWTWLPGGKAIKGGGAGAAAR